MSAEPRAPGPYLSEIDGLRCLAVLSVMLFHLDAAFLPGGFSGVDVFFVISGYVVSRAMIARGDMPRGRFIIDFYARRFVRILPALLLCLVTTTLVSIFFVPQSWLSATTATVASWAYVGASNLALVWFQDDYFSPRSEYNLFTHTWSLGVEEQFYLIAPAIVLLWLAWHRRQGVRAAVARGSLPLLMGLSALFAYRYAELSPDGAYYLLPARFWELAAGAMLSQWQASGRLTSARPAAATAALTLGLAGILAGFWLSDKQAFPMPWALLPVGGTLLCLYAVSANRHADGAGFALLRHPAMAYMGKLSYSLYLWHWPVYGLFRWTVGWHSYWVVLAVGITFVLAALSYHGLETPVRRSRWLRGISAWIKVVAGLTIMIALAYATSLLFDKRQALTLSVTGDTRQWYPLSHPVQAVPEEPKPLEGKKLYVVGNSHAPAYSTMLQEASDRLGIDIRMFPLGSCNIGNLDIPVQQKSTCASPIDDVLTRLTKELKAGDMVFFASLRMPRLIDQWGVFDYGAKSLDLKQDGLIEDARRREEDSDILEFSEIREYLDRPGIVRLREAAWRETADIVARLEQRDIWVMVDAPKPVMQIPPFRCSDWFNGSNPICALGPRVNRDQLLDLREPMMASLTRLDQAFDNVVLWDPFPALCPDDRCSAYDEDGRPLFFDGDHLSAHGNRVLYPSFSSRLLSTMGD